jgi:hypothetical protein
MHGRHLLALLTLIVAGSVAPVGVTAASVNFEATKAPAGGTVLQTNLVSDLPGVAAAQDPHLVNPWGISESSASPFWVSDNGAGVSTLYSVPGAGNTAGLSTPLTRPPEHRSAGSRIPTANPSGSTGCGRLRSAMAGTAALPTPCTSLQAFSASRTACSDR